MRESKAELARHQTSTDGHLRDYAPDGMSIAAHRPRDGSNVHTLLVIGLRKDEVDNAALNSGKMSILVRMGGATLCSVW